MTLRTCFILVALAGVSSVAMASPVHLEPTGAAAQDTFVYQSMPDFNFDASGFERFIALGKSTVPHDLNGLIRFDLAGASLAAGERATLNLYVTDTGATGFPGVSPSAAGPAVVDVASATSAWQASTATWASLPAAGAIVDSETIRGVGGWARFDVTDLVGAWLDGSVANDGFVLSQAAAVNRGGWVGVVFESSASTHAPFLEIAAVPEPTTLAAAALLSCPMFFRRKRG